jgi:hypothetical protein
LVFHRTGWLPARHDASMRVYGKPGVTFFIGTGSMKVDSTTVICLVYRLPAESFPTAGRRCRSLGSLSRWV